MMLAVPEPTAVTTPVLLTVATGALSDDQDTARPVTMTPLASLVIAVARVVAPIVRVEEASDTVTVVTGGRVIITWTDPLCPSLSAMMVAVPIATPVITPVADTVATPELSDDQLIV